eukprot:364469-Chlamydomonas_euryale.AAC.9
MPRIAGGSIRAWPQASMRACTPVGAPLKPVGIPLMPVGVQLMPVGVPLMPVGAPLLSICSRGLIPGVEQDVPAHICKLETNIVPCPYPRKARPFGHRWLLSDVTYRHMCSASSSPAPESIPTTSSRTPPCACDAPRSRATLPLLHSRHIKPHTAICMRRSQE